MPRTSRAGEVYRERISRVVDYISANLGESHSLADLAKRAHFSPFHFHRVFKSIMGEPVAECVRRLRLERAVMRLKHGRKKSLSNIALECGFASSSDFSRAFRQIYGFPPRDFTPERFAEQSKIRQELQSSAGYGFGQLPTGNPDRFRVRIVERPAVRVTYSRTIGGMSMEKFLSGYNRLMDWGRKAGLVPGTPYFGMSQDDPEVTPRSKYRYDHCLELPAAFTAFGRMPTQTLPAGKYASLHCAGDIYVVDRAWNYLFRIWMPESGFQPADAPALERYRTDPSLDEWKTFDMDCLAPIRPL